MKCWALRRTTLTSTSAAPTPFGTPLQYPQRAASHYWSLQVRFVFPCPGYRRHRFFITFCQHSRNFHVICHLVQENEHATVTPYISENRDISSAWTHFRAFTTERTSTWPHIVVLVIPESNEILRYLYLNLLYSLTLDSCLWFTCIYCGVSYYRSMNNSLILSFLLMRIDIPDVSLRDLA